MSSAYVRTEIKNFLTTNFPTENQIDLSGRYESYSHILTSNSLTPNDNWLGLQFLSANEVPASIASGNTKGLYRETGIIYLHVVEPIQKTAPDLILARAENLRDSFRGQRINDIIIEEVSPANFETGATLQFDSGFTAASIILEYYRDLSL